METCLERIEVNEGKVEIKMEACLEEMKVETIGALKDRYGDGRLAIRTADNRRNGPRAMVGPGRSWPLPEDGCPAASAVPALHKERSLRGPRKTISNGIRG
jgi:hypothetical protein